MDRRGLSLTEEDQLWEGFIIEYNRLLKENAQLKELIRTLQKGMGDDRSRDLQLPNEHKPVE